jgi:hypothetical protein
MAEEILHEYHAILTAARGLPPAEQWRLAKELVAGEHFVALWEEWQQRLAAQGDIASEAEIDATVAQVRAERHRRKR